MPLRTPPPQIPVIKWDSPNKSDLGLIEFWNTEVNSYVRIDIGTPHPNTRDYPGYTLGIQSPVDGDEKWMRRVWVTDSTNQDWYNYQIQYVDQAKDYPIFIRTYQERRDSYTPLARLSPLQTVYKLKLTATGSGYNPSMKSVALTFSSGSATGRALIDADGKIRSLILDSGGSGYTSAPTFTVAAPTAGVTATGTAYIQPTNAYLVKEQAEQYPEDNENFAIYLNVARIYMTLPGPWIYDGLGRGLGMMVDPDSRALEVSKKRINIPENIPVYANVYTGASGAITAVLTGQSVTSGTITNAGTGYADFVNLTFGASPTGRTAQGYAVATAGLITSVVITDGGTGYNAGAPTVTVLPTGLVSNERRDIDFNTAYELQNIVTQSPFSDLSSALQSTDIISYQFPSRLDVTFLEAYGLFETAYIRSGAQRVPAKIYVYFVISDTEPSLPYNPVIFQAQISVMKPDGSFTNLGDYNNVLIDANSQTYQAFDSTTVTINYPASTPSFTTYQGSWLGSDKHVDGSVEPLKFGKLWKVRVVDVTMR